MTRFAIFTDKTTRGSIFVNAGLVRVVRKEDFGDGARISFDDHHAITVVETAQSVVRSLEEGDRAGAASEDGQLTTALLDLRAKPSV
jgi:hypothetical protein